MFFIPTVRLFNFGGELSEPYFENSDLPLTVIYVWTFFN